ncbi:helix-turn-helix domain-containing protein [Candidatus Chloroploca sp. Khr17]|uniref:WD40 domain-containing protein n=1 Tax=Candidatus Chloroploca sp. Khr17 TaxID=2496869 RepID=UPI00101D1E4F|nr:helix-turn-helix domain-containing protein [Candidatus Chloroploca sp. Khr17]
MSDFQKLPALQITLVEHPLAIFAADLRTWIFSSQARAAQHFGVDRSTIWRYEEGRHPPPLAYLAALTSLVVARLGDHDEPIEQHKARLLHEINQAIVIYYPDAEPFAAWEELEEAGAAFQPARRRMPARQQTDQARASPPPTPALHTASSVQIDWGDAPDVATFYGRQAELAFLQQMFTRGTCRLLGVFGMGGAGKTILTVRLVETVADQFTHVFWRSLINAPPPDQILREFWLAVARPELIPPTSPLQVHELLPLLQHQRCLLILDNFETILNAGEQPDEYREGYAQYGQLLRLFGEARHQSCLILTSREKPRDLHMLEHARKTASRVYAYQIPGLKAADAFEFLRDLDLDLDEPALATLLQRSSGNPKILELVGATIRDLFDGSVASFLAHETILFDDVQAMLHTQFEHLSEAEQEVLFWLAVLREPVTIAQLREHVVVPKRARELLPTIRTLQRRSLIETGAKTVYLQHAVAEFVTDMLVKQLQAELVRGSFDLVQRVALLQAHAKDYVRTSQVRVVLEPLVEHLKSTMSQSALIAHLDALRATLQTDYRGRPGYAGGNLLNLLIHLGADLTGKDFAHLAVWQAYCQGVELKQVNFADADLSRSAFNETFGSIRTVAFSPNGAWLAAGSSNGEIHVWALPSHKHIYTLDGKAWVEALTFSPDSRMLASGGHEPALLIWDLATGTCLDQLAGHTTTVRCLSFSRDGTLLASGSDDATVRLWPMPWEPRADQEQDITVLAAHQGTVWSIALHPTAPYLISAGSDGLIWWDLTTGTATRQIQEHAAAVMTVAMHPTGSLVASGSYDGKAKLWSFTEATCRDTITSHQGPVRAVAFSPDGSLLATGSEDEHIRLWHSHDGSLHSSFYAPANRVRALAFSPDGHLLASGSHDQNVRLWHVKSRQCIMRWQGYVNQLRALAQSPDGQRLAFGVAECIYVVDQSQGEMIHQLCGHSEWVQSLAFSPQGNLLASSSDDHTIRLWNLATFTEHNTLYGHDAWVQTSAFTPDGRLLATGSIDRTIRLWEVATGACLQILTGHQHYIWAVAISPDGRWLASGGVDEAIRIWDIASGQWVQTFTGHRGGVWSLAFAGDSNRLVSSGQDQCIRVWALDQARLCATLSGHDNRVVAVAVCPQDRLIASGSDDRTVRIWDLATGSCRHTLSGHTRSVIGVAFHPDGERLISGSEDGTVLIWQTNTGTCLKRLATPRPYDGLNLTGATGLTTAQRASLIALGARDEA